MREGMGYDGLVPDKSRNLAQWRPDEFGAILDLVWWLAWVVVALGIMVYCRDCTSFPNLCGIFAILLLLASASILQYLLVKRKCANYGVLLP